MRQDTCDRCHRSQDPTWHRTASTDTNWPPCIWQACVGDTRCTLAALRGIWVLNARCNVFPIFRKPKQVAVPRTSGLSSPGVVAGYRWSADKLSWYSIALFKESVYETAEEAQLATMSRDHFPLAKHIATASMPAEADDHFLPVMLRRL